MYGPYSFEYFVCVLVRLITQLGIQLRAFVVMRVVVIHFIFVSSLAGSILIEYNRTLLCCL